MYSGSDQRPWRSRPPAKLVDSQSRLCRVNLPLITTGRNCGHLVMHFLRPKNTPNISIGANVQA
jgi:hypothetical protein